MIFLGLRRVQLRKDASDVLLGRSLGDRQPPGDPRSAISASKSRSRSLSAANGSARRRTETSSCTSAGSTTEPPFRDAFERVDEFRYVGDAALE